MNKTIKIIKSFLPFLSICWMQSLYPLNSIPITSNDLSYSGGGGAMYSKEISLNPSTINGTNKGVNLHTQSLPLGISLLSIDFIYPLNEIIYFSSISNLSFGNLKDGLTNESFSPNDLTIKFGLKSTLLNKISIGGSTTYNLSKIETNTAQSLLFALGMSSRTNNNNFGFGLTIRNIGFQFDQFGNSDESIPYQIQNSIFIKPQYLPILIFSDLIIDKKLDGYQLINGMKFNRLKKIQIGFSVSSLLNNNFEFSGFGFGIKIPFKNWYIGLAIRSLMYSGNIFGFTINKTINN